MKISTLFHTIRFRLTLWYAASFAVWFVVLGVLLYGVVRHRLITHHDEALRDAAHAVARALSTARDSEALTDAERATIDRTGHIVIFHLVNGETGVLYRSRHHPSIVIPTDLEVPAFPWPQESWFAVTQLPTHLIRTYSLPYRGPAGQQMLIRVFQRLGDVAAPLASLRLLLMVTPFAMIAAAFGGYWLAGRALKPVNDVTRMAREIEASRLGERLPAAKAPDEIGRLIDTFNQMIARLESSFDAMRRFTADASHELRGPLTTMQGAVDLALAQPREADEYREALASVREDIRRLRSITEDLLVLARADAGRVELEKAPVRLDIVATEVATAFQLAAHERHVEIQANCPSPVLVLGDERWLRQLVANLVDNAVKFTAESNNGRKSVTVSVRASNGTAALEVADSGPGIPEHALPRIFERFYCADEARTYRGRRGFGLGLSIAAWIVEAHRGTIGARSREEGGTVVAAAIPLSDRRP